MQKLNLGTWCPATQVYTLITCLTVMIELIIMFAILLFSVVVKHRNGDLNRIIAHRNMKIYAYLTVVNGRRIRVNENK